MIACNRCSGSGVVLGQWEIEPCPECVGTGQFKPAAPRPLVLELGMTAAVLLAVVLVASYLVDLAGWLAEVFL